MSSNPSDKTAEAPPQSFAQWLSSMPRWKKISLGVALLATVGGGIWSLTTGEASPETGGAGDLPVGLRGSLIEGGTGGTSTTDATQEPASKGIFRLGFSFVAGFSIGTFLRATLKIAAIAFGFWLLMTFVLSYMGIVVVDWQAMDSLWNRFTASIEQEWGSFQSFMLGSLPATGLAVTGLAVGLKR